MTTETKLNVGAAMAEQERMLADQYRNLARHGHTDLIDAIYGEDVPALPCGSSPRLKAVNR